jgi:hypothetical protein
MCPVTQVVNDTNPAFFYCATPGHCQKGMFGIMLVNNCLLHTFGRLIRVLCLVIHPALSGLLRLSPE